MAVRAQGHVVLCEPASRVRHERGGSSGEAFRMFLTERNRERLVRKWAADLGHQAPPADGAAGRAAARRATERRAAAVAASRPAAPPATRAATAPDERAALLRDLAVKDAFAAHAQRLLAEAAATRERLESDGADAQRALADLHARHDAAHRDLAALAGDHEVLRAERAELAARLAAAEAELPILRAQARRSRPSRRVDGGGCGRA